MWRLEKILAANQKARNNISRSILKKLYQKVDTCSKSTIMTLEDYRDATPVSILLTVSMY